MYRQHAGPPPPDPYEAGRQNARNCGYMQLGIAGMNVLTLAGICVQLGGSKLPAQLGWDPVEVSAFKSSALVGVVVYLVVTGLWAGLNAWGLGKRSKVAYASSIGFAIAMILSCFPMMFGAGLLFLLFKREMKGYFGPRPTG